MQALIVVKLNIIAICFYIASGSNSNRIVQFRRSGSDVSYIANNGVLVGAGVDMPNVSVRASGVSQKISNKYGYVEIGTRNSSHCHFQTDRGTFYFYKGAYMNGIFHAYQNITLDHQLHIYKQLILEKVDTSQLVVLLEVNLKVVNLI